MQGVVSRRDNRVTGNCGILLSVGDVKRLEGTCNARQGPPCGRLKDKLMLAAMRPLKGDCRRRARGTCPAHQSAHEKAPREAGASLRAVGAPLVGIGAR